MLLNFKSVTMPNVVKTGETFIISVEVELSTYERLKLWVHSRLKAFAHNDLRNSVLK